jgi:hypothetical protein
VVDTIGKTTHGSRWVYRVLTLRWQLWNATGGNFEMQLSGNFALRIGGNINANIHNILNGAYVAYQNGDEVGEVIC